MYDPIDDFRIPVNVPSSLSYTPPPRLPSPQHFQAALLLQRDFVAQSGLRPGIYTSLKGEVFTSVKYVYDGLLETLLQEISRLDAMQLTIELYRRHEQFFALMSKTRYASIPDLLLADGAKISIEREERWLQVSPFTETIRWLIELVVKFSTFQPAAVSASSVDRLIALGHSILAWDTTWEWLAHSGLPHELTLDAQFPVVLAPTPDATKIWEEYQTAVTPWAVDSDRQWLTQALSNPNPVMSDLDSPETRILKNPMAQELGYDIEEWSRYAFGLLASFNHVEYVKVVKEEELSEFLSEEWNVFPSTLDLLLRDHAISKRLLEDSRVEDLGPAEHARRDTRLFRRPVVAIDHGSTRYCIYGVETIQAWGPRFLIHFMSGHVQFPRMETNGPVRKAIGTIQTELGNPMRDEIAASCTEMGYEIKKEKRRVGRERIQGKGFGPVDILVVDRKSRRFVLVEVKDTHHSELIPRKEKSELKTFRESMDKLQEQINWFDARKEALQIEFDIPPDTEFSVEGVIVINYPRFWIYASGQSLPIVTEREFFVRLRDGDSFLSLNSWEEMALEDNPPDMASGPSQTH